MGPWPLVAVVYASQYVAGDVVVGALRRGQPLRVTERVAQSLLLGPAALAAQMILFSLAGIPFSLGAILAPWWGALLLRRLMRRRGPVGVGCEPAQPAGAARGAAVALVAAALVLWGGLLWLGLRSPVYESDPMNNYALAARIFETHRGLAGDDIAGLRAVGHVEYPPLVALNEALVFMAAGEERLRTVLPFFALAWLAFQLLVIAVACSRLRPWLAVPVASIALLVPELYGLGTVGLADLRLSACVLLLGLEARRLIRAPGGATAVRLAAAAAACALTKNEGMVVAAVATLPLLWLVVRRRLGARAGLASIALVVAAATVWVGYLAAHGARGGYWSPAAVGESEGVAARLAAAIAGFWGFACASLPSPFYGVLWPAAAAATLAGLIGGRSRRETLATLAALLAHLGLYSLLLAVISQPVEWSVVTSAVRMLDHAVAWPVLLIVVALAGAFPVARPARAAVADADGG